MYSVDSYFIKYTTLGGFLLKNKQKFFLYVHVLGHIKSYNIHVKNPPSAISGTTHSMRKSPLFLIPFTQISYYVL